ncbi:MAG: hypothetical protein WAU38_03390 [Ignavibacteria bacterium]|nr:hypothetical protein [Ignavibacteria bacterium]MBK9405134.1 hypothetical protein [Ignavibacteria bacterium]
MDIKLKELLTSINSRFSGPQSCRLYDMSTGRINFDQHEVREYLSGIINFGGSYGSNSLKDNSKDAKIFLDLIDEYLANKEKNRI